MELQELPICRVGAVHELLGKRILVPPPPCCSPTPGKTVPHPPLGKDKGWEGQGGGGVLATVKQRCVHHSHSPIPKKYVCLWHGTQGFA